MGVLAQKAEGLMTTQRSLRARLIVGLAAVAMGLSMVVSQTGGSGYTEAAWQDQEVGQASVSAAWADSAWAKTSVNNATTFGSFPGVGDFVSSPSEVTSTSSQQVGQNYGRSGVLGETNVRRPGYRSNEVDMYACATAAAPPTGIVSSDREICNQTGAPTYPFGDSISRARGFGTSGMFLNPAGGETPLSWVYNESVSTMVECRADGSSYAAAPQVSNGNFNGVGFIQTANLISNTSNDSDWTYVSPAPGTTVSKWIRPQRIGIGTNRAWQYVNVTSRNYTTDGYALSDVFAQVHFYKFSSGEFDGSMEFVLSRSECGVATPARIRVPLASAFSHIRRPETRPADPAAVAEVVTSAAVPDPTNGIVPGEFETFTAGGLMALQATPNTTTLTSLPPATTVTSPLGSITAPVTTTSAPPDPSETTASEAPTRTTTATTRIPTTAPTATSTPQATQTTTTTSAISAPSIPDEPGNLSATEETEEAGTVRRDGEELVVVVQGDTVPSDARTAPAALDTWINDRRQPSGNWTIFTSNDPDEDGWRWAAINQTTGTVVYIR